MNPLDCELGIERMLRCASLATPRMVCVMLVAGVANTFKSVVSVAGPMSCFSIALPSTRLSHILRFF